MSDSNRIWSYSESATRKMMEVTFSKQWIHFRRSDLWPPTSTILQHWSSVKEIYCKKNYFGEPLECRLNGVLFAIKSNQFLPKYFLTTSHWSGFLFLLYSSKPRRFVALSCIFWLTFFLVFFWALLDQLEYFLYGPPLSSWVSQVLIQGGGLKIYESCLYFFISYLGESESNIIISWWKSIKYYNILVKVYRTL